MGKLNLVQDRKFGENISMAFDFIAVNFKNTKTVIIYMVILAVVAGLVATIPYLMADNVLGGTMISVILLYGVAFLAGGLAITYAASYMKLYINSADGNITESEAMAYTKSNLVKVYWGLFLYGLAVFLGSILLIIPGIFIGYACFFVGYCMVHYDLGAVDALKKSYELTKNNWWITVGYVLVIAVIIGLATIIFKLIGMALMFLGTVGVAIGSIITYIISFVTYVISTFAIGVHFYNLVDKKEGVNVSSQIDSIGQKTNF